jgi:hypothetical protein
MEQAHRELVLAGADWNDFSAAAGLNGGGFDADDPTRSASCQGREAINTLRS